MTRLGITYDPTDPAVLGDPFPHYRQLRDKCPVYFVESIGKWAVSRYDDCVEIVRNSAVYGAEQG
jgi:cytochrome P450